VPLRLLWSTGSSGDVMPRLVGVFMIALGGAILEFVRARDYRYYRYAITARIFIVVALTALYFKARDPLFLVLDAIVLVGLLPSIYVAVQPARPATRSSSQGPAYYNAIGSHAARRPPSRITPSARSGCSPQLKRDPLGDSPSRGNDGLPRDFCSAGPTPDLRPRPPGGGTGDHSYARVPGQRAPLRPSGPLPLAATPSRSL